jgi:hypothetical protein
MGRVAVKDLGDRFSLSWSKGRNIHQPPHPFVIGRGNHRAGVSVSGQNDRSCRSGESALQCRCVIAQRAERERRRDNLEPFLYKRANDLTPT